MHRTHAMAYDKSFSADFIFNGGKKRMLCWD